MSLITNKTSIRKTEDLVEAVVDEELILMHTVSGRFYSLTGVGRRVWELLDEHPRIPPLVAAMRVEYDVPEARCSEELGEFFVELEQRTLVRIG